MSRCGLVLCAVAGLLASCSFAPDYQVPDMPKPDSFKEYGEWKNAAPSDDVTRGAWWGVFADPDLDSLEGKVAPSNQDLKAAIARYRESQALAGVARADYFPTVTGTGSVTRNRQSDNAPLGITRKFYDDYDIGAGLSYEIDVWGRVKNEVAAANASVEASAADLEALDLMLHAELASDYFGLRGYDTQQKLLDDTVAIYKKALALTEDRFHGKIASEIDVDQARTQLETARTQADDIALKRAQLEHAIAVLIGEPASTFSLPPGQLVKKVPEIYPGLPSALLERRPDIAAAERRVFAANAEIGVAAAAWFPTFSLDAMLGLEGKTLGDWLTAPSHMWSFGPMANLTIFDAGRIDSLNDQAKAEYEETVANYRQSVLVAYQETEDALAGQRQLNTEWHDQKAAADSAARSLDQANRQYMSGLVNYLQVVTAQTASLQAQESETTIQVERLTAAISLVRALGGGWQVADLQTPPVGK